MLNKAMVLGNLGRDPELRQTPSGQSVAKFSVATTRKWTTKDGERQEATEWHNVVCWGRQAEIAGQYLHKGKQVYVEGRLQTDSWEDRETGKKMYRTEIVCENFQMLGGRGDSGGAGDGGYGRSAAGGGGSASSGGGAMGGGAEDDDVPF